MTLALDAEAGQCAPLGSKALDRPFERTVAEQRPGEPVAEQPATEPERPRTADDTVIEEYPRPDHNEGMEARCYATYDEFAWFYSRGWGADFHKQAQPVLEKHVLPRLPERARILDLCCGSGDLSRFLVTRGCRVTGMDGSEEMLRYAREHAPEAEFMLGDARHFALEPMFDGVLSTFDSLNHVLSIEELGCVFGNVCGALVQGGLFAFDMNMEAAFESLWRGFFHSIEENAVGITRGSYDRTEKLGKAEITTFRREGDIWRRQDVAVLERCYSEEEIATALERAGFRDVETHDAWELGMRGDIALGRVWFFARKPGRPE